MTGDTIRKSVPISADDAEGVAALRADASWQQAAIEIAGIELSRSPSEAEAIHALVEVGRRVLESRVTENRMAVGYAALAAARTDEDRRVARATGRRTALRPD